MTIEQLYNLLEEVPQGCGLNRETKQLLFDGGGLEVYFVEGIGLTVILYDVHEVINQFYLFRFRIRFAKLNLILKGETSSLLICILAISCWI